MTLCVMPPAPFKSHPLKHHALCGRPFRSSLQIVTERGRFELPNKLPRCRFSKPVPSTTQPPLQYTSYCRCSILSQTEASCSPPPLTLRMKYEAVHISSIQPPLQYTSPTYRQAGLQYIANTPLSLPFFAFLAKNGIV